MKMIEAAKVPPLIRLILMKHPHAENIMEQMQMLVDRHTIDAVPVVHGRWKFNRDGSGTCNQCHRTQKNVWDYDSHQSYCGCCGARMDGEADG